MRSLRIQNSLLCFVCQETGFSHSNWFFLANRLKITQKHHDVSGSRCVNVLSEGTFLDLVMILRIALFFCLGTFNLVQGTKHD